MGLRIAVLDDLCVPQVSCDHCFTVIARAEDGNYQWRFYRDATRTTPIFFTHKACCRAFEAARGGTWLFGPLELLPFYLGNSLGVRWPAATQQAQMLASLFGD